MKRTADPFTQILGKMVRAIVDAERHAEAQHQEYLRSPAARLLGQPFEGGKIVKSKQLSGDRRFLVTVRRPDRLDEQVVLSPVNV